MLLRLLSLLLLLAGCASGDSVPADIAARDGPPARTLHVISNGWHAGIILARSDLPAGLLPEAADFPAAAWLEFGWGDREYYPNPRPTMGMALAAGLTPTPAVVHIAGRAALPEAGGKLEILRFRISEAGMRRLVERIDAAMERPAGQDRVASIASGLYETSLFYPARGEFHLFNTCNSWVARKLAWAGLPVSDSGVTMAEDLMVQLRPLAVTR